MGRSLKQYRVTVECLEKEMDGLDPRQETVVVLAKTPAEASLLATPGGRVVYADLMTLIWGVMALSMGRVHPIRAISFFQDQISNTGLTLRALGRLTPEERDQLGAAESEEFLQNMGEEVEEMSRQVEKDWDGLRAKGY